MDIAGDQERPLSWQNLNYFQSKSSNIKSNLISRFSAQTFVCRPLSERARRNATLNIVDNNNFLSLSLPPNSRGPTNSSGHKYEELNSLMSNGGPKNLNSNATVEATATTTKSYVARGSFKRPTVAHRLSLPPGASMAQTGDKQPIHCAHDEETSKPQAPNSIYFFLKISFSI